MDTILQRFVLTGPHAGKTIKLRDYQFKDGACVIEGTERDIQMIARFLEINWQAYPEHDRRAQETLNGLGQILPGIEEHGLEGSDLSGQVQPAGPGDPEGPAVEGGRDAPPAARPQGSTATGNGLRSDGPPVNHRLVEAIQKLDPNVPEHWTAAGKPALHAVEALYGSAAITRADIEAAAPNFDRKVARRRARNR